jgi:membrane fusion protein, multidrug efflux system
VQRLPVRVRLLAHRDEAPLRAGMTATVNIDNGRQRHYADIVTALFGRTTAIAASAQ